MVQEEFLFSFMGALPVGLERFPLTHSTLILSAPITSQWVNPRPRAVPPELNIQRVLQLDGPQNTLL